MPGRPRALNEHKRHAVCAFVSAGYCLEQVARYVGCTPITIRRESRRNPGFCEQLRQARLAARLTPWRALRKSASPPRRAAATLLPSQSSPSAEPEFDFLRTHDVKNWVERLIRSKFSEAKDSQIVDRMLTRFDTVVAEYALDRHAEEAERPAIPSRRGARAEVLFTRSSPNKMEQNGVPFCPADSRGETGNPEKCVPVDRQFKPEMPPGPGPQRDEQKTKCRPAEV